MINLIPYDSSPLQEVKALCSSFNKMYFLFHSMEVPQLIKLFNNNKVFFSFFFLKLCDQGG